MWVLESVINPMKTAELLELINGEILGHHFDHDGIIFGAYACDMLSRVVSSIGDGQVWITILNSINVVAVASLSDCPCVILAEEVKMDGDVIKRAEENNITVISSPLSAYEICGLIYKNLEI